MKRALACLLLAALTAMPLRALPPDLTYQGYFQDNGIAPTALYDFRFTLQYVDGMLGVVVVGTPQVKDDVPVTQGVFSVPLDFGAPISNQDYLLKIEVRPGASTGAYITLSPDTAIKPAVQAQYADSAGFAATIAPNTVGTSQIIDGNVQTDDLGLFVVSAEKVLSNEIQLRVTDSCPAGSSIREVQQSGAVVCETDDSGSAITGVNAGTGLTGGGSSGSVTLGIANSGVGAAQVNAGEVQVRVSGACAAGQSIRAIASNGAVTCETDDAGSGTVTSVATGTGLTGGPITGSGTIALATGGVTTTQIADGTITSADINTTQVQARVSGSCAAGSSISAVAANGTVTCEVDDAGIASTAVVTTAHPAALTRLLTTAGAGVGDLAAVTGIDGLALVAHYEPIQGDLVVVHCDVPDCSVTTRTVVDSTGDVGRKPRIAIAGSGTNVFPVVTYTDQTNGVIKALRCSNTSCTASVSAALAATAGAGPVHELSRNISGNFVVVFRDTAAGNVRAVTCTNYNSCNAAIDLDASVNDVGHSLVMGVNGIRYLAYRDATTNNLLLRSCSETIISGSSCFATLVLDASGTVEDVFDLVINEGGLPLVLYRKAGTVHVATCSNHFCSAALASTSVSSFPGQFGALTVGADGYPLVFLQGFASANESRTFRCSSPTCTGTFATVVGVSPAAVNSRPAVVRTDRDLPIFFSRRGDQLVIKVCDNRHCGSDSRQR